MTFKPRFSAREGDRCNPPKRDAVPMNWWDGMYSRRVRLTQPYERDMVWWVADTADPAWVTYEVGEEFDCSDDEANDLIEKGLAVEVEK